jgi:UDP-2,3-diacylglucosamine pyrophosphatase LpxH
MNMKLAEFRTSFAELLAACPSEKLEPGSRYLFLSDLHMGDGGPSDDLAANGALVAAALADWYLPKGFTLALNGDIEETLKFAFADIRLAWSELYAVFDAFAAAGRLRKIVGNHDLGLLKEADYPYRLEHGLALEWKGRRLFAFHGHQASRFFVNHAYLSRFIVRFLAKPLKIRNTSVSSNSRYRFKAERRIYRTAREAGLVAIAGHTHRPLFESLSKYDSLRWLIEDLLREYALADEGRRAGIAGLVNLYKTELSRLSRRRDRRLLSRSLYDEAGLLVPCLFNSGCATGKTGFTALEIADDSIGLVYWARNGAERGYIDQEALSREELPGTSFVRFLLRREYLDQVFARIELLS